MNSIKKFRTYPRSSAFICGSKSFPNRTLEMLIPCRRQVLDSRRSAHSGAALPVVDHFAVVNDLRQPQQKSRGQCEHERLVHPAQLGEFGRDILLVVQMQTGVAQGLAKLAR